MIQLERLVESREAVILNQKWLANLILRLELVEKKNQKYNTASTDGKHIFYNSDFIDSLSDNEVDFLIAHESIHVGLLHCSNRFQHLIQTPRDIEILDMAKDYVVNDILKLANFTIPKSALWDETLRGLSVEEVFSILKQENKQYKKCFKDHCEISTDQQLESEIIQAWSDSLRHALSQQSLPDSLLEKLLGGLTPKIKWNTILDSYLIQILNSGDETTWKRLSRRGIAQGLNLPSKKNNLLKTIIFCSDTSGSMNQNDISIAIAETFSAISQFKFKECLFIDVDTEIRRVINIEDISDLPTDCKGRGGTDFSSCFEQLENYYPNVVIFFSDLEVNLSQVPNYPIIWITKSDNKAVFGQTIKID